MSSQEKDIDTRIENNPSFQKLMETAKAFALLAKARPILRWFGKTGRTLSEHLDKAIDLAGQARDFIELPDRFNKHFAERGWIAYELLNIDVMRAAVEKADMGDLDGAEEELVAH